MKGKGGRRIRSRKRSGRGAQGENPKNGEANEPARAAARHPELRCALGVATLALACGAASLGNGFVWDDVEMLREAVLRTREGLVDIWLDPKQIRSEGHYWPVTWTTLWLDFQLHGTWAPGWHATNVLLHAGVCLMVGRTLSVLNVPSAWLGAALFAVHPMHAEVIGWTMARKDALAALGALAALQLWLKDEKAGSWSPWPVIALGVALLAKTSALAVLPAMLIVAWWRDGALDRARIIRWTPAAAVAAGVVGADIVRYADIDSFELGLGTGERIAHAGHVIRTQLGILVGAIDPTPIRGAYDAAAQGGGWTAHAVFWGYTLATLADWRQSTAIGRSPAAILACYGCALAPTLGLVEFSALRFSATADRYAYIANIAPLAVIGALAGNAMKRLQGRNESEPTSTGARVVGVDAAAVAVLLGLGAASAGQMQAYRDNVTFFEEALAHEPDNAGMIFNLAKALSDAGRLEESYGVAREGAANNPENVRLAAFEAKTARRTGRHAKAEEAYRRALALQPERGATHLGLGKTLESLGRHTEAVEAFEAAARHSGEIRAAIGPMLAKAKLASGDVEGALALYREGAERRPGDPVAHVNLASVLIATQGPTEEARRHLDTARRLAPNMPLVRELLRAVEDRRRSPRPRSSDSGARP